MLLMVGSLVFLLARWQRTRRHEEAARRDVLKTLTDHFDLSKTGDRRVEGRVRSRMVSIEFQTDHLLIAQISLTVSMLPPSVRVTEFSDGPYQKKEELHIGGASLTGDRDFDSKFLVYASSTQARGLPKELRVFLLAHPIEHLSLSREELSCPVPLETSEATHRLDEALQFCDALEAQTP